MPEVKVRINGEQNVDKAANSAKEAIRGIKTSIDGINKSIKDAFSFAGAVTTIGMVKSAVSGLISSVKDVTEAFQKQQDAEIRMAAAAANNINLTLASIKELGGYASKMQKISIFGDEEIIQQQSFLASLNLTENQIKAVTTAAVNYASTGMVSLDSAYKNIAKLYSGMTGELGELIPQLKSFTAEQLKAGEGVEFIARQFSGMAEAAANSASGGMKQLNNTVGDLKEILGSVVAGGIKPFVTGMNDFLSQIVSGITKANEFAASLQNIKPPISFKEMYLGQISDLEKRIDEIKAEINSAVDKTVNTNGFKVVIPRAKLVADLNAQMESLVKELDTRKQQATFMGFIRVDTQQVKDAFQVIADKARTDVAEAFKIIDDKASLFGDAIDVIAEKQQHLFQTISNLLRNGLKPTGGVIRELIGLYRTLASEQVNVGFLANPTAGDGSGDQGAAYEGPARTSRPMRDKTGAEDRGVSPWALMVADIKTGIRGMVYQMGAIGRHAMEGFGDFLKDPIGSIKESLADLYFSIKDHAGKIASAGFAAFGDAISMAVSWIINLIRSSESFQAVLTMLSSAAQTILTVAVAPLIDALSLLVSWVLQLVGIVSTHLVPIFNMLEIFIGKLQPVFDQLALIVGSLMDAFATALAPVFYFAQIIITALLPALSAIAPLFDLLGLILGALTPVFEALGFVVKLLATPIAAIGATFQWLANIIYNLGKFISNVIDHPLKPSTWGDGMKSANLGKMIKDAVAEVWKPTMSEYTSVLDSYNPETPAIGTPAAGGYAGGSATVVRPPDQYITINFNGTAIDDPSMDGKLVSMRDVVKILKQALSYESGLTVYGGA